MNDDDGDGMTNGRSAGIVNVTVGGVYVMIVVVVKPEP